MLIELVKLKLVIKRQKLKHVLYDYKLICLYDKNFPKELKYKELYLVYFIVVDEEIYKIGKSSGKSGISGCFKFLSYCWD